LSGSKLLDYDFERKKRKSSMMKDYYSGYILFCLES